MAVNRLDAAKSGAEPPKSAPPANGSAPPSEASAPTAQVGKQGIKAWLPLLANLILMPALAYGVTTFVLLPKRQGAPSTAGESAAGEKSSGKRNETAAGGKDSKLKFTAPLSGKVLVNVAGTMGTRYLLANLTLVSNRADIKALVEKNDPQLRDVAASALSSKTISDLEKPGARNVIRIELMTIFNNVLGEGVVSELYLTEFAIQ